MKNENSTSLCGKATTLCGKATALLAVTMAALLLFLGIAPVFASEAAATATPPKRVALTFDDGPHPHMTDAILDVLDKYGIKATFFVIGVNAENYPEPLKRAVAQGHEIGNHTYSHPKLKGQSAESLYRELKQAEQIITDVSGVVPVLFRPPEGFRAGVVSTVAEQQGYQLVFWSVDTLDWTGASAASIEKSILDNVKDGDIILCHDYIAGKGYTAKALERVIPQLLEEGYEFVTVSELLRKR